MNKSLEQVKSFHQLFEHPIAEGPYTKEPLKIRQLRIKLLFEELAELAEAGDCKRTFSYLCDRYSFEQVQLKTTVSNEEFEKFVDETYRKLKIEDGDNVDKTEELDALCDIQYVLNGKVLTSGLHKIFDIAFDTVHYNNMTKAHKDKAHAYDTMRALEAKGVDVSGYTAEERNGNIILLNADKKVIKPHDHVKVKLDIEELLTFRAIDSDSDTLLDLKANREEREKDK